jgi:hypothetical protein
MSSQSHKVVKEQIESQQDEEMIQVLKIGITQPAASPLVKSKSFGRFVSSEE